MEIKTNYHTHTYLCKHAEGKAIDYVKLAKAKGYEAIAITDHGPLTEEILKNFNSRRMSMDEYFNIYLNDLAIAKKEEGIKVLTGLEIEYFPSMNSYYQLFLKQVDFLILGQHYYYFDQHYHNMYDPASVESINAYCEACIQGMRSGYFRILAHPDIYCIKYAVWDDETKKVAQLLIQTAKECHVLLELNANGIRNCQRKKIFTYTDSGHISYGYPKYEFWKLVKEMDAEVIINDDVHYFKYLNDEATKEAYELAKELNLHIVNKLN